MARIPQISLQGHDVLKTQNLYDTPPHPNWVFIFVAILPLLLRTSRGVRCEVVLATIQVWDSL
jgi:hypothetical protein